MAGITHALLSTVMDQRTGGKAARCVRKIVSPNDGDVCLLSLLTGQRSPRLGSRDSLYFLLSYVP
jgi:hypothetical protein